jgi:hypothetical protein
MLAAVVLVPVLYLVAPTPSVAVLLLLAAASALHTLFSAALESEWAVWSVIGFALTGDVACFLWLGPHHPVFGVVNNSVLVCLTGTVAALWVQSGLTARHAAVLISAIGVYDFVATGLEPVTDNLLARLTGMPLAPVVSWGPVSVGLGDLLIATTAPVVYRKAFGTTAGFIAMSTAILGIATALVLHASVPLMSVLGPMLVLEYAAWRHWHGPERTTWEHSLITRSPGKDATVPLTGMAASEQSQRRCC